MRIFATVAVIGAFLLAIPATAQTPPPAAGQPGTTLRKGDHVLFSGQVTGTDGNPVGNVTVLLELSRTSFNIRRFKKVKKNTLRVPVTTTVDGRYLHDWRWDGYYNTFELAVAIPEGRDDFEILHRVDVTDKVREGVLPKDGIRNLAVVTPLVVEGTGDLGWLRELVGGTAGEDERRIFREMGQPDRVDRHEDGASAWWYFEAGKVYRFRDGALELTEDFEPIKPLD